MVLPLISSRRIAHSLLILTAAAGTMCVAPQDLAQGGHMEFVPPAGERCKGNEAVACYQKGLALTTGNASNTHRIAGIALLEKACTEKLAAACDTLSRRFTKPKKISGRYPTYPTRALWNGVEGQISVRCIMTEKGVLRDCGVIAPRSKQEEEILRGSELGPELLSALSTWRFTPATLDGQPCAIEHTFRVKFEVARKAR